MILWRTELQAIDNRDGEVRTFPGPVVPGLDLEDAMDYVRNNDLSYLTVLPEVETSKLLADDFLNQLFLIPVN